MADVPLIVIGASLGGLNAIATVLEGLSPGIPAAILTVIHIGENEAQLPRYFAPRSRLPVAYGQDKEKIVAGRVYVAPSDRHLMVEHGRIFLSQGPKENHTRPAIDPLFRSAAEGYGPLVTGVILTGHLTDGTAGLWEIKRRGGTGIVQDPTEAEVPSMPRSALRHVAVDYCLKLKDIGKLLNRLAEDAVTETPRSASHHGEPIMGYTAGQPVALTCPDCGGALRKETKGSYTQYRCHIGHTYGEAELAQAQFDVLDTSLQQSIRLLNERKNMCLDAAAAARQSNHEQEAKQWDKAAEEARARFEQVERLLEANWTRPELMLTSGNSNATAKDK
jgi:two-component system, chemotaxis family, protein-glutamate methylesterase/glutaminase